MILGSGLVVAGNSLGQWLTMGVGAIVLAVGLGLAVFFGKKAKRVF